MERMAMADTAELIEVLKNRSSFYRTLSSLYLNTLTQEQIDTLAQTDFSAFGADEPLLIAGFDDMRRYLRKRNTGTRQELAVDFTSTFMGAQAFQGRYAVPYESVYRSESGLLMQEPRNEVYRAYKKAAIKLKEGVDLPEDHLSFEFEFVAIMCDRTVDALDAGETERAVALLEAQRDFVEVHILSWFDDLAELANKVLETRFYRGVLKITKGYLKVDMEAIEDLIAELEHPDETDTPEPVASGCTA
jgi:putative dimethyl sulfoxide reductase chaperone